MEFKDLTKKRKQEGDIQGQFGNNTDHHPEKRSKQPVSNSVFGVELFRRRTPLPECRSCLDVQSSSGPMHINNTKTGRTKFEDSRRGNPAETGSCTELDLELNLRTTQKVSSWLEIDERAEEVEMVAAVCMKCHMLVMLCKAQPLCPNCKFVNTLRHSF